MNDGLTYSEGSDVSPATEPHLGCTCVGQAQRNLVICIDGTSNKFGKNNTNVIEFYSLLKKDTKQKTFYNSGIGTYAIPSWKSLSYWKTALTNVFDLAFAVRFEEIILQAYQWLSDNFRQGDRIFLFGFSRGAYQVRVLAAMIETVGLIHKGNEAQIPFAFEVYASCHSEFNEQQNRNMLVSPENQARQFKNAFSRVVRIHFVGAWDTVAAIGTSRRTLLPFVTTGMKHVCFFRHALALDERRVKFLPEYAYDRTSTSTGTSFVGDHFSRAGHHPHTKEVWFSGSHSDIGGGLLSNVGMNRNTPSLRWMYYEAISAGISMVLPRRSERRLEESNIDTIHDSLRWWWMPLEALPLVPKLKKSREGHFRCCHWGRGRQMVAGQKIHLSVIRRLENTHSKYSPKAILPCSQCSESLSPISWESGKIKQHKGLVETDLVDVILDIVDEISRSQTQEGTGDQYHRLRAVAACEAGRHALRMGDVLDALFADYQKQSDLRIITTIMSVLNIAIGGEGRPFKILYPFHRAAIFKEVPSSRPMSSLNALSHGAFDQINTSLEFFQRYSLGIGRIYQILEIDEERETALLSAGESQGITQGAKYLIYHNERCAEVGLNSVGTAIVQGTSSLTSTLHTTWISRPSKQEAYFTSSFPIYPGKNWVLRVAMSCPLGFNEFRWKVLEDIGKVQNNCSKLVPIIIVESSESPDLIVSSVAKDTYRFETTLWKRYPESELQSLQFYSNSETLSHVIFGGALYYWLCHLSRQDNSPSPQSPWPIELEWFRFEANDRTNTNLFQLADGHYKIGPVSTAVGYSFTIKNISKKKWYVEVFILNPDHSIGHLTSSKSKEPVLPNSKVIFGDPRILPDKKGHVRYRDLQWFNISSRQTMDISFLAILISNDYVDYSYFDQPSPFIQTYSERYHDFQRKWENKTPDQPFFTLCVPIFQYPDTKSA